MPSNQVSFQICRATTVLTSCSRDLTCGQTFVQMFLLLIKSKSPPNFRFQISWCIVNSVGVVGHIVVVHVFFPLDTQKLLLRESRVEVLPFMSIDRPAAELAAKLPSTDT